jgi:hypothetical protein
MTGLRTAEGQAERSLRLRIAAGTMSESGESPTIVRQEERGDPAEG